MQDQVPPNAVALTDTVVRRAKPKEKPYKLTDGKGLYLLVRPGGSRYWRLKYRLHGREKLLALGVYDEVSLASAREKRDTARKLIAAGTDPAVVKRAQKAATDDSFKSISEEWLGKQTMADTTRAKARWIFEDLLFPHVGTKPIRTIGAPEMLSVLRRIEARGKIETAHRAMGRASQVFRYAVATGRAERDPTADLRGALAPVNTEHRAAITNPLKVGELLRALKAHTGQPSVYYALALAPYLFVRPGELRAAEWTEFDLDAEHPLWRIPGERMKMREAHIVPLSHQAVTLLRELQPISTGRLLFPSLRTAAKTISENTLSAALQRLGFKSTEMTPHGFRTVASTLLNELGWNGDLIELQLAHRPRDKVRAAYNQAQRLAERRKMMQAWADYLDQLRSTKSNVVPINRAPTA